MITATIRTKKKVKGVMTQIREIKIFTKIDKARDFLTPIATEMVIQKHKGESLEKLPIVIDGVSFDTKSEKNMLLEIHAYTCNENEDEDGNQ